MTTGHSQTATSSTGVVFRRGDCASFWIRLLVDVIDIVVAGIAVLVILIPLFLWPPDDARVQVRVFFFVVLGVWLIYFVFLKYFSRTVGYRLCRVRLVNLQGQPPTLWEVFTRSMFAVIGPANLVVDLVWLSGDPLRQALRDKFAHTYVVRGNAEPSATGSIEYSRYTVMGINLLFQEVRVGDAQVTAEAR